MITILIWEVLVLAVLLAGIAAWYLSDPELSRYQLKTVRRELRRRWPRWRGRAGCGIALLIGSQAGVR